jgi:hypothetical protein
MIKGALGKTLTEAQMKGSVFGPSCRISGRRCDACLPCLMVVPLAFTRSKKQKQL